MPNTLTPTTALRALVGLTALVLLAGCGESVEETANVAAGDWPAYESLVEAVGQAELVITGTVVDSHEMRTYPDPDVANDVVHYTTTITRLRITEVFQGEASAGDVIEIHQDDNIESRVPLGVLLPDAVAGIESDDVLVLLTRVYDDGPYALINPDQGLFLVDGDEVTPLDDNTAVTTLDTVREAVREAGASPSTPEALASASREPDWERILDGVIARADRHRRGAEPRHHDTEGMIVAIAL